MPPVATSTAPAVAAARRSAATGPMRSTIRPANAELNTPTKKKALTVIPISASPMPRSSWICTARALTSVGERLAARGDHQGGRHQRGEPGGVPRAPQQAR